MDDDEYVANLLVQDAKKSTKKYELVGIDAFNPRRAKSGAPKPNTNFLRHIIRQTDSHNAALLAKEAEESNARLKEMNREKLRTQRNERLHASRKAEGRLTPLLSEEDRPQSKARRRNGDDTEDEERRKRRRHRERSPEAHRRRHRSRSRDSRPEKSRRERSNDRASRLPRHHRRRHDSEDEEERSRDHKSSRRHKRHRSRSRDSTSSRSRERERKARHRSRSPRRNARYRSDSPRRDISRHTSERHRPSNKIKRRSASPEDSDPLESLIGPLPPSTQPALRPRGRGALKSNSDGMNSRFSSTYDPSLDVRAPSDAEDEWGDALEAFRDRQRFKQQGAERLRAAGFTDAQVKRLEKGDERDGRGEEDVRWSKGGQREWDRGKVVDEDGDVELKAEWRRLK